MVKEGLTQDSVARFFSAYMKTYEKILTLPDCHADVAFK